MALAHAAAVLLEQQQQQRRRQGGGGGGGLDHCQVAGLVLVSPFTTMLAMAKRTLPIPIPRLEQLLRHPFDNPLELSRIGGALAEKGTGTGTGGRGKKAAAVSMTIVHGDRDRIVPVEMGREMATLGHTLAQSLGAVFRFEYVEVQGADHNGILHSAKGKIFKVMERRL